MASLMIMFAGAQSIFDNLVDNYADEEGFSAVQLTSDMFELYLKKKNIEEDDPVYETLKNLESIMVVTQTFVRSVDEENENPGDGLKYEIIEHYKDDGYSLFKTEKTPGSDLKIYIRKDDSIVESMGLLSSNSFSVNLIEMNGNIDLASIATLNKALNIRGLEQLRVFSNESPNQFFFNYSFPRSGTMSIPRVNKMQFEWNEEKQREFEEQAKELEEKMKEQQFLMEEQHREKMEQSERMRERSRELYEKYQRFPIMIGGYDSKDAEYYIDGEKADLEDIKAIDPGKIKSIQVLRKDDNNDRSIIKIKIKGED